ncbi:MAG TPA: hypothetical protein VHJ20_13970 [Polyangia bacterium]|nr:hypothetical protein [Polyangia bacterium]
MFEGTHVLDILRLHVALDADVSAALTSLHDRAKVDLATLLREARVLAAQLVQSQDGVESSLDLERWVGTLLRGPHDRTWFDARIECGRQGWAGMPPLESAILIARVRHRLTEMAKAFATPGTPARVTEGLGRLFDLEMAILVLAPEPGAPRSGGPGGTDVTWFTARRASLAVGKTLAVIETSAYLIGRYQNAAAPRYADIERHLLRINEQVGSARKELRHLVEAAFPASLVH